ncbi:chlorophyllase/cutinase-like alpha/beta fold protein [Acaryochloris sp. CCMEE 5410]|uniref:alpha/beta hydrolase family protein n=1 Tax=Acaryochloris sp. CCMEE 5410 TaxID=310037 RepID=UPI0002483BF4|nr:alpha/beta hydrolase [Acaryochloris sp. CCMEE 5410]
MLTAIQPGTIAIGLSTLFAVGFCHQKAYSKQFDASNVTQDNIYANTKIIEKFNFGSKSDGSFYRHKFTFESNDTSHVMATMNRENPGGNKSKDDIRADIWIESSKQDRLLEISSLPAPLFSEIQKLETVITSSGDAADIFVPRSAKSNPVAKPFPVALMLQGANVDKSHYSEYAKVVASYGFVVVIPNNLRLWPLPPPAPTTTGYYPELKLINEVWNFIKDPAVSPVAEVINPDQLVLLGHSLGGAAGLNAVQGGCSIPKCLYGEFKQPEALVAAVFYGTHLKPYTGGPVPPINNDTIPTALIFGEKDGRSFPEKTKETYQQLGSPTKMLISITGANHFGLTNSNAPNNPGNTPAVVPAIIQDPKVQDIPQSLAIKTIGTWTALFLRATVLEDPMALDVIFSGAGDKVDNNVKVMMQNPSP